MGERPMPPTVDEYRSHLEQERAMFFLPCWRVFQFHPDDGDLYGPLVCLAEDNFREFGDVPVSVCVDRACDRVTRDGS